MSTVYDKVLRYDMDIKYLHKHRPFGACFWCLKKIIINMKKRGNDISVSNST